LTARAASAKMLRGAQKKKGGAIMARKLFAPILCLAIFAGLAVMALVPRPSKPLPAPEPPVVETAPAEPKVDVRTLELGERDTLIALLLRHDVPKLAAHEMVGALRTAGANLRQVRPGETFRLSQHADGTPAKLGYAPSPWEKFEVAQGPGGWEASRVELAREVRVEAGHAEVRRSLWETVESGAVAPKVLLDFVQVFESEFDFTADTRPGDLLRFLVEAHYAEGKRVDYGRIVAAQYMSEGKVFTGVGYESGGRYAYYDLEGRSLKKTFLRSPLEFRRISSGFTYRRPHPILGGVRPHLAIDYAAPTGTPVWAVADGVVQFAGRNRGNGIQVVLRHRSGYRTYYNHLSRLGRGVRTGVRVAQKRVIGYVGSTGLSTGPHLDYRVSHHGRFVNPLAERFVPGKPIAAAVRPQFIEHARSVVETLEAQAPFQL
jgi:murein DD-endopeptidase MepM/ murein hydrolase activator NlpD